VALILIVVAIAFLTILWTLPSFAGELALMHSALIGA
jgi:hypothetical protein